MSLHLVKIEELNYLLFVKGRGKNKENFSLSMSDLFYLILLLTEEVT